MDRCAHCAGDVDRRFRGIVEPLAARRPTGRPHGHGPTVRCQRCGSFVALMHLGYHEAYACSR